MRIYKMIDAEKIDRDNPTEEERRWLQDRGEHVGDPIPVTFQLPDGTVVSNDGAHLAALANDNQQELIRQQVEAQVQARLAELGAGLQVEAAVSATPHTGTAVPVTETAAGTLTSPAEDEEDEDDDEEADYSSYTVTQLQAEIVRRNEGRADEDKLSIDGRKKDLIATLEADDEASEEDSEEDDEEE